MEGNVCLKTGPAKTATHRPRRRVRPSEGKPYKYKVLPGNNSRLLINTFRHRPWWQTNKSNGDATMIWEMFRNPKRYRPSRSSPPTAPATAALTGSSNLFVGVEADRCCLNHFERDTVLVTKHGLYWGLRALYEKRGDPMPHYLPETYHIVHEDCCDDCLKLAEWDRFRTAFHQHECMAEALERELNKLPPINTSSDHEGNSQKKHMKNIWICKPAALSNRGSGIKIISTIDQVRSILDNKKKRTRAGFIVQKYIERPLLIKRRKFDIRCFLLLSTRCRTGKLCAYMYNDGYIRTSSSKYSLSKKSLKNKLIHLTNDGVQNKDKKYGKFEAGNKMSYSEFQEYISQKYPERSTWVRSIMCQEIKNILEDVVRASKDTINPKRRQCFQLFGCDFMVTEGFEVKLIEINANPCLEFSNSYLEELLTDVVESTFQLTLDNFFPPPRRNLTKQSSEAIERIKKAKEINRYSLFYEEQ